MLMLMSFSFSLVDFLYKYCPSHEFDNFLFFFQFLNNNEVIFTCYIRLLRLLNIKIRINLQPTTAEEKKNSIRFFLIISILWLTVNVSFCSFKKWTQQLWVSVLREQSGISKMLSFFSTKVRKLQGRAAESLLSWQEVAVCSLIVGQLYLYRNNASDALFFVQFYVHGSVGF